MRRWPRRRAPPALESRNPWFDPRFRCGSVRVYMVEARRAGSAPVVKTEEERLIPDGRTHDEARAAADAARRPARTVRDPRRPGPRSWAGRDLDAGHRG